MRIQNLALSASLAARIIFSATLTLFFTGLVATNSASQSLKNMIFRDEFTGESLRPEWSIVSEDPAKWALVDGEYLLFITSDTNSGLRNQFVYEGNLPDKYEIIVKMNSTLNC